MTETPAAIMGQFRKYDHLERMKHPDVADLSFGTVHVFPKIDGTNASVWASEIGAGLSDTTGPDYAVRCGSRSRVLSLESDNAGFCAWVHSDDPRAVALRTFVLANPHLIVYGEWLVPHTLRTYREDAWRRFYVFDVYTHATGRYLPYDAYADALATMGVDVITPLAIIDTPSDNQLNELRDAGNTFLIRDGAGAGEGIVLKNYEWANKWGRQPWGKMVRGEFSPQGRPKVTAGERKTEADIVDTFCTEAFIRKTFAKVVHAVANDVGATLFDPLGPNYTYTDEFIEEYRYKIIPRFIGTVYWDFITEEVRVFVKKFKNPVVDFSKLQKLVTVKAKQVMREIF